MLRTVNLVHSHVLPEALCQPAGAGLGLGPARGVLLLLLPQQGLDIPRLLQQLGVLAAAGEAGCALGGGELVGRVRGLGRRAGAADRGDLCGLRGVGVDRAGGGREAGAGVGDGSACPRGRRGTQLVEEA